MTDVLGDFLDWLPGALSNIERFVALPLTWIAALILLRLARNDREGGAVWGMAVAFTCLALVNTVFAIIFANNDMADPVLNLRDTQIFSRGSLDILSIVAAVTLIHWWRGNGH